MNLKKTLITSVAAIGLMAAIAASAVMAGESGDDSTATVVLTEGGIFDAKFCDSVSLTGSSVTSTGGGSGRLDPRFDWCYEANAAGYGNYQRGRDPEYDWYRDGDGDGWVCEF